MKPGFGRIQNLFNESSRNSWTQQKINDSCLFFASDPSDILNKVVATQLPNQVTGSSDYLTVTGSGLDALYRTPDSDIYRTADSDYVFWKTDTSESSCDGNRLISYDFSRILVKYLNVTPYTILWIAILKPEVVVSNSMRDFFDLSIWWSNTLSAHGNLKQNRVAEQSVWGIDTISVGGTESIINGYKIHKFTSSGDFTINRDKNVEVLVVAGGGAGGVSLGGGGGGAGGVLYDANFLVSSGVTPVVVGDGGVASTVSGVLPTPAKNSEFSTLVAIHGGDGMQGQMSIGVTSGGSAGGFGAGYTSYTATAVEGQGHIGGLGSYTGLPYSGGGGGGAGEVGHSNVGGDRKGGNGLDTYSDLLIDADAGVDIDGVHWIAGGGGGGYWYANSIPCAGGKGGGGTPAYKIAGTPGTPNTGGGGAGASGENTPLSLSSNGGSGIVIIRYLL
jgi:hypothetical protein